LDFPFNCFPSILPFRVIFCSIHPDYRLIPIREGLLYSILC
jgi:hypothetical protein